MTICDGYIRVSRVGGREGERFISPTVQREQIEHWAAAHGYTIGKLFEELDQSGGRADRPLLTRALARQESGEAQVLCVAILDRFGRDLLDGLQAIRRVKDAGGRFVAVREGLDSDSDAGKVMLQVMLSLAEWQLDRIRSNWAEAQRRAIARGVFTGSSVPLGYRRLKSGRLAVNQATAPLVRDVFARRVRADSVNQLADYLSEHVPSPEGKARWSHNTVRTLLRRRVYLGEVSNRGHVKANAHPTLIDRATWEQAQLAPQVRPSPRQIEPALLVGLLRCAGCSRVMMTKCEEQHRLSYACPQSSRGCPAPATIYASKAEPYVEAVMWGRVKGTSAIRQQAGLRRAQDQLEAATDQLERYRDHPTLQRTLGPKRFAAGLVTRVAREEAAIIALAEVRAATQRMGPSQAVLRERWPTMTLDDKTTVLQSWLDCVFVRRGKGPAQERLWAIPKGEQPPGLPPRAPKMAPPPIPFAPNDSQARAEAGRGMLDWSKRKVTYALKPFLAGRSEWPSFREFQTAGMALAYANATRHQTVGRWAQQFSLAQPIRNRTLAEWSEERVRRELTDVLDGKDYWPTVREFTAMGKGELRKAVLFYGGAERWANEMRVRLAYHQQVNRTRWTEATILQAVSDLADGQDDWPTLRQFRAAGLEGLYESINKTGMRRQLAHQLSLRLPPGPRYRPATRWTPDEIDRALNTFLIGRSVYPTRPEFVAAGLGGLHQKLGRSPRGHDAVAKRFDLARSACTCRPSLRPSPG